jgi:hypothetical protein
MPGNDYEPKILSLLERIMGALERIAENTAKTTGAVSGTPPVSEPSKELYGSGHGE